MNAQEMFKHWSEVRDELCQALDRLTDAQLDFIPHAGLWSLRETVCHIAGAEEGWFRYCATRERNEWPEYPAAGYPTIASLKTLLTEVHNRTVQFFSRNAWSDADGMMNRRITLPWNEKTTLGWITWHVLEHEIHHRGEVFLMLGLQGIQAPDI